MKKLFLALLLLYITSSQVLAQSQAPQKATLTENSVVRDEEGMIYPYLAWSRLVSTGDYTIKGFQKQVTDTVAYVLVKRTQQEKDAYLAKLPKPAESTVFKKGDIFKPFKDKDINGEKFDLKQLAGKVVVINFWFIGCPPCRKEIPDLNNLVEVYKGSKDVVFIAIALDGEYEIKEYLKTQPFNYHIIESGRYYASRYKVQLFPTNLVLDKEGKVAFSSVSYNLANPYWIKKTINEVLADKTKQAAL